MKSTFDEHHEADDDEREDADGQFGAMSGKADTPRPNPLAGVLSIGIALAYAAGAAHATIDLDAAGTVGTVRVSAETLSAAADRTVVVDGETYLRISTREPDLQVEGRVGVSGAAGRQVFIRLQFNNMVFAAAATDATVHIPDRDTETTGSQAQALTLETGAAIGSSHVAYSAPTGTEISQDAIVRASLHGHLAILPGRPGNITQTMYLDLADAFNGRRPLAAKQKTAVRTVRSLTTAVTPGTVNATVASLERALSRGARGACPLASEGAAN